MKRHFKRINLIVPTLLVVLLLGVLKITVAQGSSDNIYKQLKLLDSVIAKTVENYVDPIDYKKFISGGIRGALSTLDPHTQYFKPKDYEELKTDTKGEFGGLGIQIGLRNGILTVISPMEGTPAYRQGLQAGDQIIKIEGHSTKGLTIEDAVQKLRGPKGSKVTITVRRFGEPKPIDFTIVRDIIKVKSVPYYGVTSDGVGYIRLTRFSQKAYPEMKKAIQELKSQNIKGLILDLRSNPGGLLDQAVRVASLFLDDGDLVVYTKGKYSYRNQQFTAISSDVKYLDGKLIVLVNGGSASASEIVTGAIQDHDRGIVMGQQTFGKGLVQNVIPLEDGNALKITTAKYYIPSGRCIQKENYLKKHGSAIISEYSKKDTTEEDFTSNDFKEDFGATAAPDDTSKENLPEFKTDHGRVVYGGGGIFPDVEKTPTKMNRLEFELERKSTFFSFAVEFASGKEFPPDFEVTDDIVAQFRDFLREKDFKFTTRADDDLDKLAEVVDSTMTYRSEIDAKIADLRAVLEKEKEAMFNESDEYIRMALKRDIISKLYGEKARYEQIILKDDKEILAAAKLILNDKEYASYLK